MRRCTSPNTQQRCILACCHSGSDIQRDWYNNLGFFFHRQCTSWWMIGISTTLKRTNWSCDQDYSIFLVSMLCFLFTNPTYMLVSFMLVSRLVVCRNTHSPLQSVPISYLEICQWFGNVLMWNSTSILMFCTRKRREIVWGESHLAVEPLLGRP